MATKTILCILTAASISTFQEVAGLEMIDRLLGKDHDYYAKGLNKRQSIFFDQAWKEEFRLTSCQFLLPDSLLTLCFVLVVSYIFYMIIAICMKSELKEQGLNKDDAAVKALLGNHTFKDNLIPSKLKSAYETGSYLVVETAIKKAPLPTGDLVTTNEANSHIQCCQEENGKTAGTTLL